MNKPEYTFGDLVRVNGYWPRVFQVDGYRTEHWHYPDEEWTDEIYELYDVASNDWVEAISEDLTLVAPVDQADEYLRANPPAKVADMNIGNYDATFFGFDFSGLFEGGNGKMAKEPRKPTAREISAQEAERRKAARKEKAAQIDNLLDIANWNRKMLAQTNNEAYGDMIFGIDAELKKLTEADAE